jgi:TatD DNase family protein
MAIFFDTHAHLDDERFAQDLPDVVARAQSAGIERINCIATDLDSSRKAIQLAAAYPNVYASVGFHPSYAADAPDDIRPALRELAKHPKVVALGESGLDYYRLPSKASNGAQPSSAAATSASSKTAPNSLTPPLADDFSPSDLTAADQTYKAKQISIFQQHLEVAAETGLGVVIHERESMADLLKYLEPFSSSVRGVFHCFAADPAAMQRVIAMGSIVSFTGILTFKNGQNMRDTLAATPMRKFMLETDSPYLAPIPHRGKRCEPAFVKEIADTAAQVKKCSLEELSAATCQTANDFFYRK